MEINVRLKKGPPTGKPAFFYDATFDDKIEICGGPVWKNPNGAGYGVGLPSKTTEKGNRIAIVKLSPSTEAALYTAVMEEVKRYSR